MKNILFTCIVCLFIVDVVAQTSKGYSENVLRAESLTKQKAYTEAAKAYSEAFAQNDGKATNNDRYNAACVWALAGNKDSAFYHLIRVAEKGGYSNYNHITIDTDLDILHSDPRWNTVLATVKANKEKEEVNYNKPVVAILDTVYKEDQSHRQGIVELIQKLGMQAPEVKERLSQMAKADSINTIKVTKILDEYGWLGRDKVGSTGSLTLFLVIQHAPYKVQKKYLPMLRAAVANKQASASHLALLEDRVALAEGKKQIYGSQVGQDQATGKSTLSPLEDPDNVDKRRAEVGLGTLATYLQNFGITWDLESYKKQLAEDEKKAKESKVEKRPIN
ncbi:MAG TPA: DUF6624 domain-containing protein [Segetibacter sp.]|jgi:hypothetical protein